MCQALPEMVVAAEAQRRDTAEEHLHPSGDGNGLAEDAVRGDQPRAYAAEDSALDV